MFKKTLLTAMCLGSFCFADNFTLGSSAGESGDEGHKTDAHVEEQNRLPQRVVIEDINPSSELGQLVNVMLKNEQKKAMQSTVAPKPKKVVKKKKVAKKPHSKKKVADKKSVVKKDVQMEIKSEDAAKVDEQDKKDAEHNENNSSLKKISSSNVCD